MSEGKIEQVGTPDEIYDNPASPFVFSFIGESNMVPVRVEHGKVWIDDEPLDLAAIDLPSGPARLYFRPHDVEIGEAAPGAIQGQITMQRRHGGSRRLDLDIGGGKGSVEIELPAGFSQRTSGPIGVRPRRWQLYS
jgi:sulfate transport system ATP-binding protein